MNYRKVNNLTGWITGAIAYIVYLMTMEPTVSFWDCGEFLSCAYKLEVGHSPGAPFFMLVQRLFAIFSGGTTTGAPSVHAAAFINSLSVLTSALTILFLFWTITYFAKKLIAKDGEEPSGQQTLMIMGAGLVGALAYTFSDTFWFSAVEAEVYGTSSFFTAITFWAILKWEQVADNKYADRWLVLIAYLIGVSVCVHLLNLLTIPALAMVYYFKRYEASRMGTVIAFVVGCAILAFVQFGVIQYIPKIASAFDIKFTNDFGMHFDTGAITFLVLLVALLVFLLTYAKRKRFYLLHTSILCVIFIVIGYSSYLSAIVRSRADVPIDMTNPDNPISFLDYVDREQFGQQPLFWGQDFNSPMVSVDQKGNLYAQTKKDGKDYYEVVGKKLEPVYDQTRFFPRIYDNEPAHAEFYKNYLGLADGETATSGDNLKYFFGYQMNWMWWRYFMWNYAGRQNDFEGQGDPANGNWISGISFIDKMRGLGDINKMGSGYSDNGARNQLYFLPLILGILGIVFQFNRDKKNGIVVLVLFFFTGAAIGIYLNMPPLQPRERDYAFAGCTYTFAIWIGLGVLMIQEWLAKSIKGPASAYGAIGIGLLAAPIIMGRVEWDDHDRSRKWLARDVAYNTLESCAKNAVLFTYGDNQTYPLWYLQEVEGVRPDVRIINTSLLGIDWYIDQLNYRINDADAVPMIWKRENYIGDRLNYIRVATDPRLDPNKYYPLADVCKIMDDNVVAQGDASMPASKFFVPTLTKAQLVERGLIKAADTARVDVEMKCVFPTSTAQKNSLAILNIVAAVARDGWQRPIYFDAGLRQADYAGTGDYMRLEGLVYRLMPFKVNDSIKVAAQTMGSIDDDKSYDLFMNKYRWGGAERNDVYFDEPNRHEFMVYRSNAAFIAMDMATKGRKKEAEALLDKVMTNITEHSYPYNDDFTAYFVVAGYYRAGAIDKAQKLANKMLRNSLDRVGWVSDLSDDNKAAMGNDVNEQFSIMQSIAGMAYNSGDTTTAKSIASKMQSAAKGVSSLLQTRGNGKQ